MRFNVKVTTMKKSLRHILIGAVVIMLGTLSALVIADTVNQEKQLLADGDSEKVGTADWTVIGVAATKETGKVDDGEQVLRLTRNASTAIAYQSILTVGEEYRVTGWARGDGASVPIIFQPMGFGNDVWTGTSSTDWQYFDVSFTASGSADFVLYGGASLTYYTEWDDILVTEYTPPIVNNEDELLVDGDMDEDGTDIPFMKKFDLTQAANITADSGSITGALTYTCAGADFDGTNDYVTYTIPSTLFSTSPEISIVMEFTPDFAYDDNAVTTLYSSTSNDYRVYKNNNAGNNVLGIVLKNTLVEEIASATYSAYWNQNARNVLVVSGTTGDTDVWLNGTQILTNDAAPWVPAGANVSLFVGSAEGGTQRFDGEIHAISIYSGLLDGTDATNLYNSVDTSDWTVGNSACVTKQSGGAEDEKQIIRIANTTANPYAYQGTTLTVGKTYRVTGWVRSDGNVLPKFATGITTIWTGTTSTDWQYFDQTFTADHAWAVLSAPTSTAEQYAEFDDVLVTEYTPPMVNDYSQLLVDGDMEIAGVGDWVAGASAALTKVTDAAESGTQIMKIAYTDTMRPYASQTLTTAGTTYRATGWTRSDGAALPRFSDSGLTTWTGTTSTDWQYFDVTYLAAATNPRLISVTSIAGYTEWDDVFITQTEPQYNHYGQILVDGDMEAADATAYTVGSSATLSKESADPHSGSLNLKIAYNGLTNPNAYQTILTVGQEYRLTGWARGDSTAVPSIYDGGLVELWTGTNSSSWQNFDETFTAANTTLNFYAIIGAAGYTEFDDVILTRTD